MISRGLKFGDGKTRIAIWRLNIKRLWNMPNSDPCQIITPLVLVGLGLGVGEGLGLGEGLVLEQAQWYDAAPESSPQLYHRLLSWGLLSGAASYHCACCTHGTAAKFFDYYAGMRV